MKLLPTLLTCLTAWIACAAGPGLAQDLDQMRGAFSNELKKADLRIELKRISLEDRYAALLQSTREQVREMGDLDGLLLVDDEIQRFENEKTWPSFPRAGALQAIQVALLKLVSALDDEHRTSVKGLLQTYLMQLDARRKALTQAGELEQALEVDREFKAMQGKYRRLEVTVVPAPAPAPPPKPREKRDRPEIRGKWGKRVQFGGHAYQLVHEQLSWDEAYHTCRTAGGTLLIIDGAAEQDFISRLVGKTRVWLGARRGEGGWIWSDRRPVTPWSGIDMDANDGGEQNCLSFDRGSWRDITPGASKLIRGYVCEWSVPPR